MEPTVLTALLGFGLLVLVATIVIYGARAAVSEYRRHSELVIDLAAAERDAETYWLAVRLIAQGFAADELQDELCRRSNCTPAEATSTIAAAHHAQAGPSWPGTSDLSD